MRIETSTQRGVADVAYCFNGHAGWLELKQLSAWPKRESTPIRIPSLKLEQVLFLESWRAAKGNAYLLMQIEKTYCLLSSDMARFLWSGKLTKQSIQNSALVMGTGHFPTLPLVLWLTKGEKICA